MKISIPFSLAALAGLSLSVSAFAQGRPPGVGGGPPNGAGGGRPAGAQPPVAIPNKPADGATAAEHLAEVYGVLAKADANGDGKLDQVELTALAQAIASGAVVAPEHRQAPIGVKPDINAILGRLAATYARIAPLDVNGNGALDAAEVATLDQGIEELRQGGQRGPGHRGAFSQRRGGGQMHPVWQGVNAELIATFDTNGDGTLDEAERATIHTARDKQATGGRPANGRRPVRR